MDWDSLLAYAAVGWPITLPLTAAGVAVAFVAARRERVGLVLWGSAALGVAMAALGMRFGADGLALWQRAAAGLVTGAPAIAAPTVTAAVSILRHHKPIHTVVATALVGIVTTPVTGLMFVVSPYLFVIYLR